MDLFREAAITTSETQQWTSTNNRPTPLLSTTSATATNHIPVQMMRTSQSSFHRVRLCGCSSVMSSVAVVASAVLLLVPSAAADEESAGWSWTTTRFDGRCYAQKHKHTNNQHNYLFNRFRFCTYYILREYILRCAMRSDSSCTPCGWRNHAAMPSASRSAHGYTE